MELTVLHPDPDSCRSCGRSVFDGGFQLGRWFPETLCLDCQRKYKVVDVEATNS